MTEFVQGSMPPKPDSPATMAARIAELERSVAELKADKALTAALLANAPVMMMVVDGDMRVHRTSDALQHYSGRKPEQMLRRRCGRALDCLHHLEDPQGCGFSASCGHCVLRRTALDTLANGQARHRVKGILSCRHHGGQDRAVLVTTVPLEGPHPRVLLYLEDITDYQKGRQALDESRQLYQAAVEGANDAVAIVRGDRHLFVNGTFLELFGYAYDEIAGAKPYVIVDPEDRQRVMELNRKRQAGEAVPLRYEFKGRKKDGTPLAIEVSASAIHYRGRPATLAFLRDVTERQRMIDELEQSRARYRSLAENSQDYIMRYDPQGRHLYMNPAALKAAGLTEAQIIGKTHREAGFDEDLCSLWEEGIDHVVSSGKGHREVFGWQSAQGPVHLDWRLSPEFDDNGKVVSVLGISRDVSQQKRTEQVLRLVAETGIGGQSDVFCFLVRQLAVSQQVRCALIARLDDAENAHTVAVWANGALADNFSYSLKGTPCENVATKGVCFYPRDIQERFPEDHLLVQMGAESYWGVPLRDGTGRVLGILAILDDRPMDESLTTASLIHSFAARAASEMARLRAQENYETLFREMLDGFALHAVIYDDKGNPVDYRFLAVNPAFERLTGLNARDILGKTVLEVMPGTEKHWIDAYGKVALTGEPAFFENFSRELDRHFEVKAYRPALGQFACIFIDVTERRRAHEEILKSREQFMLAVNGSQDGIWDWDLRTNSLYLSPKWKQMIGYDDHELPNVFATFEERLHPDDRAAVMDYVRRYLGGEVHDYRLEFRFRHRDGSWRWILARGEALRDDNGVAFRMAGSHTDITERKQLEERRLKTERLIQHSQRIEAIGVLAGGIAHDFNNILFPIIGLSEILMEDIAADNPAHEHLEAILKAAQRARELVKQILAFSRQADQESQPIRVQNILKEVLVLARSTLPATIEIRQRIDTKCGPVLADPVQIHQVVMNLITNALHAMEATGGVLDVQLAQTRPDPCDPSTDLPQGCRPGDYVCLTIADTGCGMNQSTLARIFDPYFTTKETGKGTGLGLAVVSGIVKSAGGQITVASEPDTGTVFRVFLPLIDQVALPEQERAAAVAGGTERILLVDDEAPIVRMEKNMLERLGYRVTTCPGGVEAIEAFKADPDGYDLVITDMTMPKVTGLDLVRRIKTLRPQTKVIVCTGFSEQLDAQKASDLGLDGFIMKPMLKGEIAGLIRRVLNGQTED